MFSLTDTSTNEAPYSKDGNNDILYLTRSNTKFGILTVVTIQIQRDSLVTFGKRFLSEVSQLFQLTDLAEVQSVVPAQASGPLPSKNADEHAFFDVSIHFIPMNVLKGCHIHSNRILNYSEFLNKEISTQSRLI